MKGGKFAVWVRCDKEGNAVLNSNEWCYNNGLWNDIEGAREWLQWIAAHMNTVAGGDWSNSFRIQRGTRERFTVVEGPNDGTLWR